MIRELAEQFKGQFECLGENTKKYITFSIPIKKQNDDGNTITYKIKFINSCRFMESKLSNLADNVSEINNKDCEICMERKKNRSECEFIMLKNNRLNYKCKECNKKSAKSVNDLIEKFPRTYKFCNGNLNKFVLLLRKGVYPYEYMDSWERFNETSLPPKKSFYSELNLEDISDKDYFYAQKVWNVFEIRNLGEYHNLYVQTDTSSLADILEKFRNTCIEIYGLDPSHFWNSMASVFKKTNGNLELLTDVDVLLMIKAGIRGAMFQSTHRYARANNKYMKNYDKSIESSYLM